MNEKLHELRQQYFNLALSVEPEEILSILPPPQFSNFLEIVKGVIEALKIEIETYNVLLAMEEDLEEKQLYITEIRILELKCRICEKVLNDSFTFTDDVTIDESKKVNVIFGITPSGSIALLNDIKRNVDSHYYPEVLEMLDQLEAGDFVNNQEKVRKFNSNNNKLSGLMEIKGFQLRLFFRQLPNNIIYVEMLRVKKDDRVTKDFHEPIKRIALLSTDLEYKKRRIKNGDRVEELILEGEEMLRDVKEFLNMNIRMGKGKNGE